MDEAGKDLDFLAHMAAASSVLRSFKKDHSKAVLGQKTGVRSQKVRCVEVGNRCFILTSDPDQTWRMEAIIVFLVVHICASSTNLTLFSIYICPDPTRALIHSAGLRNPHAQAEFLHTDAPYAAWIHRARKQIEGFQLSECKFLTSLSCCSLKNPTGMPPFWGAVGLQWGEGRKFQSAFCLQT